MNFVFWLGVILCAFVLWLAISFVFIPLGKALSKRVKEISDIIDYEESDKEQKEKEKNG